MKVLDLLYSLLWSNVQRCPKCKGTMEKGAEKQVVTTLGKYYGKGTLCKTIWTCTSCKTQKETTKVFEIEK